MKITEILNRQGLGLSFEVFPPKESTSLERVRESALKIANLKPDFLSVTYGAGGQGGRWTVEIARDIQQETGVPAMAHLTCVASSREALKARVREIRENGIENIMALRGDLPQNADALRPVDQAFGHASELIAMLREELGDEVSIGGACYPEIHPESETLESDIRYLRAKVDAGCDFLTTQMFFDNALFYRFLYRLREAGVMVPVVPGIMPITSSRQIERARKLSGSFMPQRFLSLVDSFGHSPEAMEQAGIIYATDQIIDLFANHVRHVHVYTMNHPHVAQAILENLAAVLKADV